MKASSRIPEQKIFLTEKNTPKYKEKESHFHHEDLQIADWPRAQTIKKLRAFRRKNEFPSNRSKISRKKYFYKARKFFMKNTRKK